MHVWVMMGTQLECSNAADAVQEVPGNATKYDTEFKPTPNFLIICRKHLRINSSIVEPMLSSQYNPIKLLGEADYADTQQ